jgi:predicted permease
MLNASGAGASRAKPLDFELDTSLDPTVIGFTALIVILTTLFFGLLPALRASGAAPNAVLKEHGHGSVSGGGGPFTLVNVMVAVQVGLALTLLSAAALFGESFRRILTVDSGFEVQNVVRVPVEIPQALLATGQRMREYDAALERVRSIPGVRSAAHSDLTPLGHMTWNEYVYVDGYKAKPVEDDRLTYFNSVSPGYFETMGTKLIAGRDFDARDTASALRVVIIGETTARTFWGRENPLGQILKRDSPLNNGKQDPFVVIGIVKDMKYESLSEQTLKTAFVSSAQEPNPRNGTNYVIRLDSMESAGRVLPLVRAALLETDKNFSLQFEDFDSQVSDSLIRPRLIAVVSGFFGAVALILAATGLYGVISYSTARRRTEIGLRMALGAGYRSVIWLVLRDIGVTLIMGAALGLTAAHFAGRLVESMVFDVRPTDPSVLGVALAMLVVSASIAAYLPARRAARVDPMDSLRME